MNLSTSLPASKHFKEYTISRKGWNVPPWPRKNATPHHTLDLTSEIFITSSFTLFTPSLIVSISSVTWDSNPNKMSAFISTFTFTANSLYIYIFFLTTVLLTILLLIFSFHAFCLSEIFLLFFVSIKNLYSFS